MKEATGWAESDGAGQPDTYRFGRVADEQDECLGARL